VSRKRILAHACNPSYSEGRDQEDLLFKILALKEVRKQIITKTTEYPTNAGIYPTPLLLKFSSVRQSDFLDVVILLLCPCSIVLK
jgi:hypothetical protein